MVILFCIFVTKYCDKMLIPLCSLNEENKQGWPDGGNKGQTPSHWDNVHTGMYTNARSCIDNIEPLGHFKEFYAMRCREKAIFLALINMECPKDGHI